MTDETRATPEELELGTLLVNDMDMTLKERPFHVDVPKLRRLARRRKQRASVIFCGAVATGAVMAALAFQVVTDSGVVITEPRPPAAGNAAPVTPEQISQFMGAVRGATGARDRVVRVNVDDPFGRNLKVRVLLTAGPPVPAIEELARDLGEAVRIEYADVPSEREGQSATGQLSAEFASTGRRPLSGLDSLTYDGDLGAVRAYYSGPKADVERIQKLLQSVTTVPVVVDHGAPISDGHS